MEKYTQGFKILGSALNQLHVHNNLLARSKNNTSAVKISEDVPKTLWDGF